jgi:hypothetical protein
LGGIGQWHLVADQPHAQLVPMPLLFQLEKETGRVNSDRVPDHSQNQSSDRKSILAVINADIRQYHRGLLEYETRFNMLGIALKQMKSQKICDKALSSETEMEVKRSQSALIPNTRAVNSQSIPEFAISIVIGFLPKFESQISSRIYAAAAAHPCDETRKVIMSIYFLSS